MKTQKRIHLLFMCAVLAALGVISASCSKEEAPEGLVASVNGTGITKEKLDLNVEMLKGQYAAQNRPVADKDLADFKKEVLDNLISNQLLLDYANDKGYTADDDAVTQQISGISSQFGSTEEYKAALEARGFTEESLQEEVRSSLIIKKMLDEEVNSKIEVTDEEVANFYRENPSYFQTPESVTASHILIKVDPSATDQEKQAAKEKIEAIRQEIVDGADFAEVAREKSEGPSATSGGSLGTFTRGQMVAPFEEAAFALEPGELSDVVLTQFGYHIILVEKKTPAGTQPLDEVKGQIKDYLASMAEQDDTAKLVDNLKDDATIEYFD